MSCQSVWIKSMRCVQWKLFAWKSYCVPSVRIFCFQNICGVHSVRVAAYHFYAITKSLFHAIAIQLQYKYVSVIPLDMSMTWYSTSIQVCLCGYCNRIREILYYIESCNVLYWIRINHIKFYVGSRNLYKRKVNEHSIRIMSLQKTIKHIIKFSKILLKQKKMIVDSMLTSSFK